MDTLVPGPSPLRPGETMSISRLSRFLDVPVPTIRSWERRYGVPIPRRTSGGHRRYTPDEVDVVRRMRDEIVRGTSARDAARRVREAATSLSDPDPHLEAFLEAVVRVDAAGMAAVLDEAAEALGVERAVTRVALPALVEVGDRWAGGRCDVGEEHLATAEVRAWLSRMRRTAPPIFRPIPIVLSAAPGEGHSVGVEAFGLLLARRGWGVLVLGARTPADSIITVARKVDAGAVVVACQWTNARRRAVAAVEALRDAGIDARFYAGAAFAVPKWRKSVLGTYLGDDLLEAVDLLEAEVGGRAA